MKKTILFILTILISLSLVSCKPVTYDELRNEYITFIDEHRMDYDMLMDIYNTMSYDLVYATITVTNVIEELDYSAIGSGVIYDEDASYYYALTNSHVIGADKTYLHHIEVTLANGVKKDATLMAFDITYDLAVIRFSKSDVEAVVIEMASENPSTNTIVMVLGHPDGQVNAMTIGYYEDNVNLELTAGSIGQIEFDVFKLSAPVQSGSSGSVAINESYRMIGLIFAGDLNSDDIFSSFSYAIPIEKIYEFLTENELSVGDHS